MKMKGGLRGEGASLVHPLDPPMELLSFLSFAVSFITRMHSSRMKYRPLQWLSRGGGREGGVCLGCVPGGVHPLWKDFLTDAYGSISFPPLLLRMVNIANCELLGCK